MKHIKPFVLVGLLILLLGTGLALAQQDKDCGVLVTDGKPQEFIRGLGSVAQFELERVKKGSLLTLEAHVFQGDEVIANLVVADSGETIYMSNATDRASSTIILTTFFAEPTKGITGEIVWNSAPNPDTRYTLTLDCPERGRGQDDLGELPQAANLPSPLAATDSVLTESGPAEGVSFTVYNRGIQIIFKDEDGNQKTLAFVPPDIVVPLPPQRSNSVLLAGNERYGFAIFQLPDNGYYISQGPDKAGRVQVTQFDTLPPKNTRHFEYNATP